MTDRRPMKRMVRTFMHRHPRSDRGLANALAMLVPVALLMMVALVPIHIASRESAAAVGPLLVVGTVYDSGGVPVAGATVNVSVWNGPTLRAWLIDSTILDGSYSITFGSGTVWDPGNTIVVTASHNADVATNSTVAPAEVDLPAVVDIHFGTVIPEFGGPLTLVLAVGGVGMMAAVCARRRGPGST